MESIKKPDFSRLVAAVSDSIRSRVGSLVLVRVSAGVVVKVAAVLFWLNLWTSGLLVGLYFGYSANPAKVLSNEIKKTQQDANDKAMRMFERPIRSVDRSGGGGEVSGKITAFGTE